MTQVPRIFTKDRCGLVAAVSLSGLAEALAIGSAAFAMRDVFFALHNDNELPTGALIILTVCAVIVTVSRIANRTVAERLGHSYTISVRHLLYRHLAGQPLSQLAQRRLGALSLRFVGDLSAMHAWAGKGLTHAITAAIVLPAAALTLWTINPTLASAAASPFLLLCIVMIIAAIVLGPIHRPLRSYRAQIAINMIERISIAPLLDRMRRTYRELKVLDQKGQELSDLAVKRVKILTAIHNLPEIGLSMAGVMLLWHAFQHDVAAAEVAASLAILAILITPLRTLASVWDRYSAWRIAQQKLAATLASPSTQRRPQKAQGAAEIIFDSASLRGISANLTITAGATVLITGPSGSGKSTFLRLAAGLEKPDQGILMYGKKINAPRTVIVGANGPILQGSLRRALSLGAGKRPDDDIIETVAHQMGLTSLLNRVGGLSGRISAEGNSISDGEAVRIHLARAMIST